MSYSNPATKEERGYFFSFITISSEEFEGDYEDNQNDDNNSYNIYYKKCEFNLWDDYIFLPSNYS